MIYLDIIAILFVCAVIYLGFTNFWRLSPEVVELVGKFKVQKRKDLNPQFTSTGLLRVGKSGLWDGLCHLDTDDYGIYVASLGMPYMYVPWKLITVTGNKRLWLKKYSLLQIEGFPDLTWCVPPKYVQLNEGNHEPKLPNK